MNARYEELVGRAPDGIVVHDGEKILEVNGALLRMARATHSDQFVGGPVSSVLALPYLKGVEERLLAGEYVSGSAPASLEQLQCLDGTVRQVEVTSQLFLEDDQPAVHLVLRDVTDRLDAEREATEQRERDTGLQLVSAIRALSGGVAHAVNNTLQIIIGFATVIDKEAMTDAQRLDLDEILSAANVAASITRQLSQFAGQAAHRPCAVALAEVVPQLYASFRELAGAPRPMHLRVVEGAVAVVDRDHLQQIFDNLTANAYRATVFKGDVFIAVRRQAIRTASKANDGRPMPMGDYVTITIRDTGVGMSQETQSRILEPFFTTNAVGQGNGLGLSATQGMLVQNDGFLTFSSELKVGSTFTVWLPSAASASAS